MPITEATGFGQWREELGSVSATPALVTAEPTRAVVTLFAGGFGGDLRWPFTAGWSVGIAVRSSFRTGEEYGKSD